MLTKIFAYIMAWIVDLQWEGGIIHSLFFQIVVLIMNTIGLKEDFTLLL